MKKLPQYHTKLCFLLSLLTLAVLNTSYRLLVTEESLSRTLVDFVLPLLAFCLLYHLEYHFRIMEKVCLGLQQGHMLCTLLPMFLGGVAAVFHHRSFLNWFLPVSYLLSSFAVEKEVGSYDSRLTAMTVHCLLFLGLSLRLTHYAAAAVTVAILGIVLLLRHTVYGSQNDRDFYKGICCIIAMLLWIASLSPLLLEKMLFIAVSEEDYRITGACMELFSQAQPWGEATLILSEMSDLLPYAPGYLVARYGWLSLISLLAVITFTVLSGFSLVFLGLPRHTSTLAVGSWIILTVEILSWLLKGASIIVGFESSYLLNASLAVLILQPIHVKFLDEITLEDVDYDMQEVCSIILLPESRAGAEALALYSYDCPSYTAWTVLFKRFFRFFNDAERKMLLLRSADLFGTTQDLRKIHPEYYETEEQLCPTTTSNS